MFHALDEQERVYGLVMDLKDLIMVSVVYIGFVALYIHLKMLEGNLMCCSRTESNGMVEI